MSLLLLSWIKDDRTTHPFYANWKRFSTLFESDSALLAFYIPLPSSLSLGTHTNALASSVFVLKGKMTCCLRKTVRRSSLCFSSYDVNSAIWCRLFSLYTKGIHIVGGSQEKKKEVYISSHGEPDPHTPFTTIALKKNRDQGQKSWQLQFPSSWCATGENMGSRNKDTTRLTWRMRPYTKRRSPDVCQLPEKSSYPSFFILDMRVYRDWECIVMFVVRYS